MKINPSSRNAAIIWLTQQSRALGRMYDREVARGSSPYYVRIMPFKPLAWREAISLLAARYAFAARVLRELPDEVPDMVRGFPPYGRARIENMDRRAQYVAKMWDKLGWTKDADAALRAAYEGLANFLVVE